MSEPPSSHGSLPTQWTETRSVASGLRLVSLSQVLVLDVGEPVALQAWIGRIDLQFECGEFGGFLLITAEIVQAGLEADGEKEGHRDLEIVLMMVHWRANCC